MAGEGVDNKVFIRRIIVGTGGAMQAAAAGRPVAWSELGILAIGAFAVFLGAVHSVSRARS